MPRTNADTKADLYARPYPDGHFFADGNTYLYTHRDADGYTDSYYFADGDTDRDADRDTGTLQDAFLHANANAIFDALRYAGTFGFTLSATERVTIALAINNAYFAAYLRAKHDAAAD